MTEIEKAVLYLVKYYGSQPAYAQEDRHYRPFLVVRLGTSHDIVRRVHFCVLTTHTARTLHLTLSVILPLEGYKPTLTYLGPDSLIGY